MSNQNIIKEFTDIVDSFKFNKYNRILYDTNYSSYNVSSFIELAVINEIYRNSLDEYDPQYTGDISNIKKQLFTHQSVLLQAMIDKEDSLRKGIQLGDHERFWSQYAFLSDSVGSGKTLVVLAYIAYLRNKELYSIPHIHYASTSLLHSVHTYNNYNKKGKLIVVPHTLYRQWEDAIRIDTTLNVLLCKNISVFKKENLDEQIIKADAVLVSNTLYQQLQDYVISKKIGWSHIFVDEADSIHFPATRTSFDKNGDFIWLITATWATFLINSLPYFFINRHIVSGNPETPSVLMRTLLAPYLDKDFLQIVNGQFQDIGYQQIHSKNFFAKFITDHPQRHNLIIRCRDDFRKISMQLPSIITEIIRCRPSIAQRIVNDFLKPNIQMLLHVGDITGALSALGVEKQSESDLITAITDNQQKELLRLKATYDFKQTVEYATPHAKEVALQHLQTKISSLEEQIKSFKERLTEAVCPICYDETASKSETIIVPCCKQIYCGECILKTLSSQGQCAMCRQQLTAGDLHRLGQAGQAAVLQTGQPAGQQLSKQETLLKILEDNPTGKILVFSHYENPFYNIQQELQQKNITVSIVQGNKDVINSTLDKFRTGTIRVLLMSNHALYAGLNLQEASHIIFYHGRMSSGEETQIIGRAQRIGRKTNLKVIKLLHPNEEHGDVILPPITPVIE
jgi:SNF2 family DNA or RNA helicase